MKLGSVLAGILCLLSLVGCTADRNDSFLEVRNHVLDGDVLAVAREVREDPSLLTARYQWDQSTLLHIACVNVQRLEMVKALLELGAAPNARDDLGRTPLHLAFKFNAEPSVIDVLLSAGADPKTTDVKGRMPKDYSIAR